MTRTLKVSEVRKLYGDRALCAAITSTGDVEVFELRNQNGHPVGSPSSSDRAVRLVYLRKHATHVATRNTGIETVWWVLSGNEWCRVMRGKGQALPFDLAENRARDD